MTFSFLKSHGLHGSSMDSQFADLNTNRTNWKIMSPEDSPVCAFINDACPYVWTSGVQDLRGVRMDSEDVPALGRYSADNTAGSHPLKFPHGGPLLQRSKG